MQEIIDNDIESRLQEIHSLSMLSNVIISRLRKSQMRGDVIPSMVSRVVWQSRLEIAKTWIDSVAREEFQVLQDLPTHPETREYKKSTINVLMIQVSLIVSEILNTEPTTYQRFTSRAGLMMSFPENLDSHDQDRIISNNLSLAYHDWIILSRILAVYPEYHDFLKVGSLLFTRIDGGGVRIESSRRIGTEGVIIPQIPGVVPQEIQESYVKLQKGKTIIIPDGGLKQIVEFTPATLRMYSDLIAPEKDLQVVRNLIYNQSSCLAWKNRFGKKGKKTPKEEVPQWKLVLER